MFRVALLLLTVLAYHEAKHHYPAVFRDEKVKDNLFGTEVVDPYRWLENSTSKETKHFIEEQNNLTFAYIQSNPNLNSVKQSLSVLYNYTRYGIPRKHGNKYYMTINSGLQNQAIIYSLESLDDPKPKIFFDPNSLSTDGTVALSFIIFSPDGKYCAYGTSAGGSDWIKIRVKNTETLEDLPDELTRIKFAYVGWNKNNKGFFYSYYDTYEGTGEGTETEIPKYQKLYYHTLNTSQENDVKITGFDEKPMLLIGTPSVSESGKHVHIFPTEGTSSSMWLFAQFNPDSINSSLEFTTVAGDSNLAQYDLVASLDNTAYVLTNYKAKNFRLVRVDLDNPSMDNWIDLIAESDTVLTGATIVNNDYLVCLYMINVVNVIKIFNLTTGEFLFDVDTPIGQINSINAKTSDTEFFFKVDTFLSPGIIYRYNFNVKPNKVQIFKQSTIAGVNMDDFEVNQIFFSSKDLKVKIPMFLVHRKNLVLNGKNPTMLNAYGGFNINILPSYNQLGMFFVKNLDGIYAVANIRGGGEYGEDWHKAGMKLNKQNVFDDFASAGEWLIVNNYTSRDYLTINGRSNGGLLVGASSNQRPDIFGASLANVGVMDMIRFPLFTIGYAWTEEYGDPQKNGTEFQYIYGYSPLHNIRTEMTQYPHMLVLTADHDDRVVPAHSFKFISELQYRLGAKLDTPLMIRIDSNSGHGAGKPVSKWIEEYADIVCFLMNGLPYKYHP